MPALENGSLFQHKSRSAYKHVEDYDRANWKQSKPYGNANVHTFLQ